MIPYDSCKLIIRSNIKYNKNLTDLWRDLYAIRPLNIMFDGWFEEIATQYWWSDNNIDIVKMSQSFMKWWMDELGVNVTEYYIRFKYLIRNKDRVNHHILGRWKKMMDGRVKFLYVVVVVARLLVPLTPNNAKLEHCKSSRPDFNTLYQYNPIYYCVRPHC